MKLYNTNVFPAFSTPIYVSNAVDFEEVIDLEIKALGKLKRSINNSFNLAVQQILKCQSKVILCGVGKSGLIAIKLHQLFHQLVHHHFYLSANDSSHGDLGSISKKIFLILISNSGETNELKILFNSLIEIKFYSLV